MKAFFIKIGTFIVNLFTTYIVDTGFYLFAYDILLLVIGFLALFLVKGYIALDITFIILTLIDTALDFYYSKQE